LRCVTNVESVNGVEVVDVTFIVFRYVISFKSVDDLRDQRNRAEAHGKNAQVRYGREAGGRPKTGKRGNNKIFDSSICLQINIRAATENRESESANTELGTAQEPT
jgi:hypothetical protein